MGQKWSQHVLAVVVNFNRVGISDYTSNPFWFPCWMDTSTLRHMTIFCRWDRCKREDKTPLGNHLELACRGKPARCPPVQLTSVRSSDVWRSSSHQPKPSARQLPVSKRAKAIPWKPFFAWGQQQYWLKDWQLKKLYRLTVRLKYRANRRVMWTLTMLSWSNNWSDAFHRSNK